MSANPDPKPPSTGSNPVFDNIVRAVGQKRAGQLFNDFTADTKKRVELIGTATTVGDAAALQHEAHNLRGTAGHFGFQDLSDLAGEIETACRNGDAAHARDLARRVQQAAQLVLDTAAAYARPGAEDEDGTPENPSI